MLKRDYKNLIIELRDFHFAGEGDLPADIQFCFLVLKDNTLSAGKWWPYSSPDEDSGKAGIFIRGTADTIPQQNVNAWLPLEKWNIRHMLEDKAVNRISVGSDKGFSVEITGFHSIADKEFPKDGQYCLLILHNGSLSGGRWLDTVKFGTGPGFFEHAPAACIIEPKKVSAWAALDKGNEASAASLTVPITDTVDEEEREHAGKDTHAADPDRKFSYGYDMNAYLEKVYRILKETYPWTDENKLKKNCRYSIEKKNGSYEYVKYTAAHGRISGRICDEFDTADQFIDELVIDYGKKIMAANKETARYEVSYSPRELTGGWYLEHYIFYRLQTGDYKVNIQAGDRTGGANREIIISPKCFEAKSFDEFLDLYLKLVPGGPFGLDKEDLIHDDGLKKFLGY